MIQRITDFSLGSIATTKLLTITSNEIIYTISSGNRALEIRTLGSQNITYGGSSCLQNSGGLIYPGDSRLWDHVVGDFTLYLAVASNTSNSISVIEYAGG